MSSIEEQRQAEEQRNDGLVSAGTEEPDGFFVEDRDPNYRYRWMNRRKDVHLSERMRKGWEFVRGSELPPDIAKQVLPKGQETQTPGGGEIRMRGDLVLMRMTKENFAKKVQEPIERNRHRQAISIDTIVSNANRKARKAVQDRLGPSGVRADMVFETKPDKGFEDVTGKET